MGKPNTPVTHHLLRQFVGYKLKRVYMHLRDDLAQTLEPMGLRIGTFSALGVVMESAGMSQTQLGRELNIKRSGVVVLVDELEQMGAIERQPVESDRRAYALHVTPAGRALWERAESAAIAHEDRLLADVPQEELDALHRLLSRAAKSAEKRR